MTGTPQKRSRTYMLETGAVICSALYTLLITYQVVWCWIFALAASLMFLVLCWKRRIYAESALHIFYAGTAIYGWAHWNNAGPVIREGFFSLQQHALFIVLAFAATGISGYLLKKYTDAALPYLDSFTTIFSIGATLLMINLILENWLYWIAIDFISIFLYARRKLWLTAILFAAYTFMAINGYYQWVSL